MLWRWGRAAALAVLTPSPYFPLAIAVGNSSHRGAAVNALPVGPRLCPFAPANLRRWIALGRRIRPVIFLVAKIDRNRVVRIATHEVIEDRPQLDFRGKDFISRRAVSQPFGLQIISPAPPVALCHVQRAVLELAGVAETVRG